MINTNAFRMTDKDFFNFCIQNRDLRFERDKNQNILVMTPTHSETGRWNANILAILWMWNNSCKLGYAFDSSTGFTLSNGAVRSPDAAWIKKGRWEALSKKDRQRFAHICPDFVIELKSEYDSIKILQDKMQEWLENGCRLGWLIDLEHKKVYIYVPDKPVRVVEGFNQTLSGNHILHGFKLNLKDLLT
ncbi:MAG: Uma2 family endonuclease [Bacteroidia bacterium]|nr:Uma2 family endonuclease [Bacteroidia bacterium]